MRCFFVFFTSSFLQSKKGKKQRVKKQSLGFNEVKTSKSKNILFRFHWIRSMEPLHFIKIFFAKEK